jgi:hypothetical protein
MGDLVTAFIKNITFDCANPRRVASFWSSVTGYLPTVETEELVVLHAPDGRGVRQMLFYAVPESKIAKNRMHVDLASKEPQAEIARLIGLGATRVEECAGQGATWTVMLDPEGNEVCVG